MWQRLADFILRHRIALLICIAVLTAFMGWEGRKAEIQQEFVKVIPEDDPEYQAYKRFQQTFGEDANAVIVGLEAGPGADSLFRPQVLMGLHDVNEQLRALHGVERVLNIASLYTLRRDSITDRLKLEPIQAGNIQTQAQADSLRSELLQLPFYDGLLLNKTRTATLCIVSLDSAVLNSKGKKVLVNAVQHRMDSLAAATGLKVHYSGVPYIRTYISQKLPNELALFMALAVVVTAVALFVFYRSGYAVVFPLILLACSTVCTFGLVGLLGYKLTLITGLIPPLIVILGIPPSIYMLSDYHAEFVATGDKIEAIRRMVHKLGLVTLMINANTAFGFLTLYFTKVQMLREFGMLAFLATLLTYVLTIVMLPGIFSLLPAPNARRLKHLDSKFITKSVRWMDVIVQRRKALIYGITLALTVVSIYGLSRIRAISFMVDDLPNSDAIYTDLAFMEANFDAVMPFEIVVDTKRPNGVRSLRALKQLDEAQRRLQAYPEISRTLSLADAMKWVRQSYFGGDSSQYALPVSEEFLEISRYARGSGIATKTGERNNVISTLVDSTYQRARITGFVKDVGSVRMPILLDSIRQDLNEVFYPDVKPTEGGPEFMVTGTTKIFLKANDYLINNLIWSLVATFAIVALQMFVLFGSFRIMVISLIPNLIPLAMTAAIMGLFNIELKPSTALIFGIAFGIAIDNSIHYLSAYRFLRKASRSVKEAVSESLRTTGMSIIYTSAVLFVGFGVFAPSAFGSTRALGILTSVCMLIALFSNLLLLPLLLRSFDQEGPPSAVRWLAKLGIKPLIDEEQGPDTAPPPTDKDVEEGAYLRPQEG